MQTEQLPSEILEAFEADPFLKAHRMGDFISSVANHEAKLVVCGLMQPDIIYPRPELRRIVIQRQEPLVRWDMDSAIPWSYCEGSLAKIGLVTREVSDRDSNIFGYLKTPYGNQEGDVATGQLLSFSDRYPDLSLIQLLGETQASEEKRSPLTRFRILWTLLTNPLPLISKDICKALGEEPKLISLHLIALGQNGIITYRGRDADKPYVHPGDFTKDAQSSVDLTPGQRQLLYDFLVTLGNLVIFDEETIREGKQLKDDILGDFQKVGSLLTSARDNSTHSKASPPQDVEDLLWTLIQNNPGSSSRDLQRLLEEEYDKALKLDIINERLRALKGSNRITPRKQKTANYWEIVQ